jgi:D-serine deaminase-like pyridoxal phosphate-dependent protein
VTRFKVLPLTSVPGDAARLPTERPLLRSFPTPIVTLSDAAVENNLRTMAKWCSDAGVGLAPHGKTTMSRSLWQRQLDAGAWGITVATPWQLSVALEWDVSRVMLANALVQPDALRFIAPYAERVVVWADSVRGVEIMDAALSEARAKPEVEGGTGFSADGGPSSPLAVLVEFGAAGGRTGARSIEQALVVARAVAAAPSLRLAGVAGYEGVLAHTGEAGDLATVRRYLVQLVALHDAVEAEGLYPEGQSVILTAGGSAYFDVVADVLAPRHDPPGTRGRMVEVLLRSGAYITHDDGFYRGITPLGRVGGGAFRAAIHGWATVVSRPEAGLALVDAGKRDFPFDEGLPIPQGVRRFGDSSVIPLEGAVVTAMNDQHSFVSVPEGIDIEVGDVIRFGLSHPCTTFDKWRALAVLDDIDLPDPRVIGLLETYFG